MSKCKQCDGEVEVRGLCRKCYNKIYWRIYCGYTTWLEQVENLKIDRAMSASESGRIGGRIGGKVSRRGKENEQ